MMYRVGAPWGALSVGRVVAAADVAGCNMAMLVARGVLVPVPDQPTSKRKPVRPATKTAHEPEEQ